ncbi:DUF421 domain-containing protein [Alkalihalobacillus sp. MEB130]|uniref:DUF421 domain-containing protein n=1 Tax=Alkalihalobacillus sp. MEB130 TaxID=2976704 RepID=UPI0028DE31DA|nr:DUF421 domain-containing protein [Alkalihalobacillus sp. MEB130]MDT8860281.1 DUF421 domain-containing protein [Alkalihalobacillus sp. MEB130]
MFFEMIEIVLRGFLAFSLLITVSHFLGKQTISQMTIHDFIGAIMIGGIAGNLTFNLDINITHFITALFTFCGILYLATYISMKNRNARVLLSGEPTVVIQDGKILENNLRKMRMTIDSLNQALREKDIFNIDQVEFALIESDGHLSVMKKSEHSQVTKKDIGLASSAPPLFPLELIMDGQIVDKNLKQNDLSKDWLFEELKQRGFFLHDVSYCVRGTNGQLYVDLYKDHIHSPIDIES